MIKELEIINFRGLVDKKIELGKRITVIAGKNGTSKSTILGLLGQPFVFYGSKHRKSSEDLNEGLENKDYKTIFGDKFEATFSDIFKFSPTYDTVGDHPYILHLNEGTLEKTKCYMNTKERRAGDIRYNHYKDENYTDYGVYKDFIYPTIYLGLSRVFPIGESKNFMISSFDFSEEEKDWFSKNYKKIMHQSDDVETKSFKKENINSLGGETSYYDIYTLSAGQDNIGKILGAILSFKRLKKKLNTNYKGGLLLIDEIDVTLFGASKIRLYDLLFKECKDLKLQIVFTTHSLTLLEYISGRGHSDTKLFYFNKVGKNIMINKNIEYSKIKNDMLFLLNDEVPTVKNKKRIFFEDDMGKMFFKDLIKPYIKITKIEFYPLEQSYSQLKKLNTTLDELKQNVVVYDGEVTDNGALKPKNAIKLPGGYALEMLVLKYLNSKSADDEIWDDVGGFTQEFFSNTIFNSYQINLENNNSCKRIFKDKILGKKCYEKFLKNWPKEREDDIIKFVEEFKEAYNYYNGDNIYDIDEILK